MSNSTENPPHTSAQAPIHPAAAVQAIFRDDDHQTPFINRDRIVETAKKWAELTERINALIQDNAALQLLCEAQRVELNAADVATKKLRDALDERSLEINRLQLELARRPA